MVTTRWENKLYLFRSPPYLEADHDVEARGSRERDRNPIWYPPHADIDRVGEEESIRS
jgi:hypothetical protein